MKHYLAAAFAGAALLLPGALEARSYHHHNHYHDTPGYYRNVDGVSVHRPMHSRSRMPGSSAVCRDGSQSFSRHHRGTCSHHGGVASYR
jgi:hypothetical protein